MARRHSRLLPVALVLAVCLIGGAAVAGYYFIFRPASSTQPNVLIHSPQNGAQVQVGQEMTIHSSARDDSKVTRIELWVDSNLQQAESSTLPGGVSPLPLLARWQPTSPGTHTLTVRAFNVQGRRGQASIRVEAAAIVDRDGDGVADATDACPDQAGSSTANGCPDRDGDGIADAQDTCPTQAGEAASNGCPVVTGNDRDGDRVEDAADACPDQAGSLLAGGCPDADGDGVRDSADACPGQPGSPAHDGCPTPGDADGDGVADSADACPSEVGPASTSGCPDSDSDGVRDSDDACPSEAGLPALGGCPDRDGDGVRDLDDICPDVAGPVSNGGCPTTGAGDRDSDGLTDDVDRCPDEPGLPEDGGCPIPGGGGGTTGGDDLTGGDMGVWGIIPGGGIDSGMFNPLTMVEVQALTLRTGRSDYDQVNCYVSLAGEPTERYGPFDTLGEYQWDIAEYLGGANSARLMVQRDQPVDIRIECNGLLTSEEPIGTSVRLDDLGSYAASHPPSDWDGRLVAIEWTTDGSNENARFGGMYRICSPACESTALPAPLLALVTPGGNPALTWSYEGNRDQILGFRLYINDTFRGNIVENTPNSMWIWDYLQPSCGGTNDYRVTAYSYQSDGTIVESPRSNEVSWTATACTRRVRVTFDKLETGSDWGARDELAGGRPASWVGPIEGTFWANVQSIDFDLAATQMLFGPIPVGEFLETNTEYDVLELFRGPHLPDSIPGAPLSHPFIQPNVDSITVDLEPDEDLTISGWIMDHDVWTGDDTLFHNDYTILAVMIYPGFNSVYRLTDGNITLTVQVEMLAD